MTRITGAVKMATANPTSPEIGDEYYNTSTNTWLIWSGNNWLGTVFTSSSTSTTTTTSTSTSTTTTTTSTSTTTTTSTSTSTTTTN